MDPLEDLRFTVGIMLDDHFDTPGDSEMRLAERLAGEVVAHGTRADLLPYYGEQHVLALKFLSLYTAWLKQRGETRALFVQRIVREAEVRRLRRKERED